MPEPISMTPPTAPELRGAAGPVTTCHDCSAPLDESTARIFTLCETCWQNRYRTVPPAPARSELEAAVVEAAYLYRKASAGGTSAESNWALGKLRMAADALPMPEGA